MPDIKPEDITPVATSPTPAPETVEIPPQDPLKTELERVQKSGRTEKEKAEFSLRKNAQRVVELGGDPNSILGIKKEEVEPDDNAPVTRAELNRIMASGATRTALQLAEDIEDSTERELTKHYLENRITPSGDSAQDLRDARRLVNALKNEQIIQETQRKTDPKTHSSGSGAPAHTVKPNAELTADELVFTRPPFNMTREAILKLRP